VNVLNQEYELTEGNKIILHLTNPVQKDILDDFRFKFLEFLRSSLNNNSITISAEFLEEESKKMIYTNKEKFNYLAEKNPYLKKLQEKLGLDPDF